MCLCVSVCLCGVCIILSMRHEYQAGTCGSLEVSGKPKMLMDYEGGGDGRVGGGWWGSRSRRRYRAERQAFAVGVSVKTAPVPFQCTKVRIKYAMKSKLPAGDCNPFFCKWRRTENLTKMFASVCVSTLFMRMLWFMD